MLAKLVFLMDMHQYLIVVKYCSIILRFYLILAMHICLNAEVATNFREESEWLIRWQAYIQVGSFPFITWRGHHIDLLDRFKHKNTSVRGLIILLSRLDNDINGKSKGFFAFFLCRFFFSCVLPVFCLLLC